MTDHLVRANSFHGFHGVAFRALALSSGFYNHVRTNDVAPFVESSRPPKPINFPFADIVPPDLRTTIYAFDRAFEGSISALAAPLVGVLAEVMYGYKFDVLKASEPSAANARALSNGLFACMAPSFGICAATYGLLYRTYHKDKDRVDARVYKDKERRPLKLEES